MTNRFVPLIMAASLAASAAHADLGTAMEFYNPALRHYFITANPIEAAMLDAGTTVRGWRRTGGQFDRLPVGGAGNDTIVAGPSQLVPATSAQIVLGVTGDVTASGGPRLRLLVDGEVVGDWTEVMADAASKP